MTLDDRHIILPGGLLVLHLRGFWKEIIVTSRNKLAFLASVSHAATAVKSMPLGKYCLHKFPPQGGAGKQEHAYSKHRLWVSHHTRVQTSSCRPKFTRSRSHSSHTYGRCISMDFLSHERRVQNKISPHSLDIGGSLLYALLRSWFWKASPHFLSLLSMFFLPIKFRITNKCSHIPWTHFLSQHVTDAHSILKHKGLSVFLTSSFFSWIFSLRTSYEPKVFPTTYTCRVSYHHGITHMTVIASLSIPPPSSQIRLLIMKVQLIAYACS